MYGKTASAAASKAASTGATKTTTTMQEKPHATSSTLSINISKTEATMATL